MEYLSVFSKPSFMLTLKIMSFNGNYVNFGCHKEISVKIYIHHKLTNDIIFKIVYILFLPKLQLFNLKTILLLSYIGRDRYNDS